MVIKDYEPNMVLATTTYDVVGTRPIRHDGTDKVTGRAQYGGRHQCFGPDIRSYPPKPSRPREDQVDRHEQG